MRKSAVPDKPQNQASKSNSRSVQVLGDFELKKRLGKGGMGEVFLARQVSLDRVVALKTLSKELSKRDDFVQRFHREARAMAKLDHVNVVKVYAVDSFKGIHFAAIEFVDGQSLQNWLNQLQQLSIGDAVHVAIVCAEALRHAHEHNMIHRDIKPDNILVTSKGVVKVADFGLAKVLDDDVSMTQSGTGLGTPLYMAPEQARNAKHVDQRTDIYALGATLYHMLTGALPFKGETTLELIIAKEKGTFTRARSLRPEIPEKLDLIIDKLMARDPNHRYKDCNEVIRDLMSLGVHHETLSFIEGVEPGGNGLRSGQKSVLGGNTPSISMQKTQTVEPTYSTGVIPPPGGSRVWYVQFENAKGKTVLEKHSTGRVLKMIAAGTLTAKTKGKAAADGVYMPLAQFPEFAEAIENQLAHRAATVRKEDMGSLYAKVAKAEKNRHKWRFAKDVARGLVGWTSLILWVGGIGIALWFGIAFGMPKVREFFDGMGLATDQTDQNDSGGKQALDPMDARPGSRNR